MRNQLNSCFDRFVVAGNQMKANADDGKVFDFRRAYRLTDAEVRNSQDSLLIYNSK